MKTMHLTPSIIRKLLNGTIGPAEAEALGTHLQEDCPVCEEVLAAGPADLLDGRIDRALTALAAPLPQDSGNDLEYARIRRRLEVRNPGRWSRARWLAVAATLLVVAGASVKLATHRPARDAGWDGVKGGAAVSPSRVAVRLSVVAVLAEAGAEARLWKVASGDAVPRQASVQLQIEVDRPADVAMARVGSGGDFDVFWHQRVASAGSVSLSFFGQPAAYPLSDLTGTQRWLAIASPEPLSTERIRAAVRALAPPAQAVAGIPALRALSTDVVELVIR